MQGVRRSAEDIGAEESVVPQREIEGAAGEQAGRIEAAAAQEYHQRQVRGAVPSQRLPHLLQLRPLHPPKRLPGNRLPRLQATAQAGHPPCHSPREKLHPHLLPPHSLRRGLP